MTMADGNRKIYNVDEDVLKRVVAGDTSALNELDEKTGEKKKVSLNDDFVDTYITAVTEQEDAMPITF